MTIIYDLLAYLKELCILTSEVSMENTLFLCGVVIFCRMRTLFLTIMVFIKNLCLCVILVYSIYH